MGGGRDQHQVTQRGERKTRLQMMKPAERSADSCLSLTSLHLEELRQPGTPFTVFPPSVYKVTVVKPTRQQRLQRGTEEDVYLRSHPFTPSPLFLLSPSLSLSPYLSPSIHISLPPPYLSLSPPLSPSLSPSLHISRSLPPSPSPTLSLSSSLLSPSLFLPPSLSLPPPLSRGGVMARLNQPGHDDISPQLPVTIATPANREMPLSSPWLSSCPLSISPGACFLSLANASFFSPPSLFLPPPS